MRRRSTNACGISTRLSLYLRTGIPNKARLIDDEYGDVYLKYLLSQIDLANAEFGRYNASAALFNAAYARYCDHLTRTRAANVPQKGVIV